MYLASHIVNANDSIRWASEKLCVARCVADCISLAIPQPTEWQGIGNQTDAVMIFARTL